MLADDTCDIRHLFYLILRKLCAEVVFAENGQVAYEKGMAAWRSAHPFDAIPMGIEMPALDGLSAVRKLRDGGYRGTIVAHTTNLVTNNRETCLQAGCDDFLAKPFRRRELLDLMSNHLQSR